MSNQAVNETTPLTPVLLDKANDISAFCSKDANRYVITGIHVNECTEATDGRMLIRVPFVDLPYTEFPPVNASAERVDCILPAKLLTEALSKAKGNALPVLNTVRLSTRRVSECKLKVQLASTDLDNERTIEAQAIDGNYPNTEQIWPKEEPKLSIALGSTLLRTIADYAEKHGKENGGGTPIKFEFINELSPVRFSIHLTDGRKATGVVMPMRPESKAL